MRPDSWLEGRDDWLPYQDGRISMDMPTPVHRLRLHLRPDILPMLHFSRRVAMYISSRRAF